jgi:uncharacterized protein YqjF (DUF2071 family)
MLPMIEGVIARRMLLNFRADAEVVQRLLPPPLRVDEHRGHAIVGVCLIRLEKLRPSGLPGSLGLSSENMAHRVAIRYPAPEGVRSGVFIWRRETDQRLVELLGGRLFPGVHGHARFRVRENENRLAMDVVTDGGADVSFSASVLEEWRATPSFATFDEASEFFRRGDCGFSCSLRGDELEGLQLKTLKWAMVPMQIESQQCAFYSDPQRFPAGSIEFDCGLLMRGLPHEWHQMTDIPELAAKEL